MKQLKLNIYKGTRGGRRPGCGRKRIHSKGVAHRIREEVKTKNALHVNFKYKAYIRNKVCLKLLKRAILNSRRHGLRIIHFSLQSNHVHLILEAETNLLLTRGMRSLTVTFAKGLQMGKVQIERYHLHVLKSLRETRNAVHYVLFNNQKHGNREVDEYSSLLNLPNAIALIREFAMTKSMSLVIRKKDEWKPDESQSYFLKRALVHEGTSRS